MLRLSLIVVLSLLGYASSLDGVSFYNYPGKSSSWGAVGPKGSKGGKAKSNAQGTKKNEGLLFFPKNGWAYADDPYFLSTHDDLSCYELIEIPKKISKIQFIDITSTGIKLNPVYPQPIGSPSDLNEVDVKGPFRFFGQQYTNVKMAIDPVGFASLYQHSLDQFGFTFVSPLGSFPSNFGGDEPNAVEQVIAPFYTYVEDEGVIPDGARTPFQIFFKENDDMIIAQWNNFPMEHFTAPLATFQFQLYKECGSIYFVYEQTLCIFPDTVVQAGVKPTFAEFQMGILPVVKGGTCDINVMTFPRADTVLHFKPVTCASDTAPPAHFSTPSPGEFTATGING